MHSLLAGTTLSGKTTLARKRAKAYHSAGAKVLVLDPLLDAGWIEEAHADMVTAAPPTFLRAVWAGRNCAVFIDEAGDAVGRFNKPMEMTATRGRHWGHQCHYISQRPALLSRTVQTQCLDVYAFLLDTDDADTIARNFVLPGLRECSGLNQGEFLHGRRFGPDGRPSVTRHRLW